MFSVLYIDVFFTLNLIHSIKSQKPTVNFTVKRTCFCLLVQMYNLFLIYTNFCTYFFKLFLALLGANCLIIQR